MAIIKCVFSGYVGCTQAEKGPQQTPQKPKTKMADAPAIVPQVYEEVKSADSSAEVTNGEVTNGEVTNGDGGHGDLENQEPKHSRYWGTDQDKWKYFVYRCKRLKTDFTRMELSGSLGDLGTLIPLLLGLAKMNIIQIVPALFFAGLFNIITGFQWDMPMCVQPMKSISAVAIAGGLTAAQVSLAGIFAGGIVFFLGVTKLIDLIHKIIPTAVIYGIQLGVGLKLLIKGAEMVTGTMNWVEVDSMTTGLILFVFMLFTINHVKFPTALVVFLIGLFMAIAESARHSSVVYSFLSPVFWAPEVNDWKVSDITPSLTDGALPQIPLTTLNSVIAVCMLAEDLFSAEEAPSRVSVATSVGTMNVVACFFGAMPMCHGSGGLAGQYKFGARTGSSVIYLGSFKILIAIFIGSFVDPLLQFFPMSVLGVMLVFAGMELAVAGRRIQDKEDAYLAIITAGCVLAKLTKNNTRANTGLGATVGLGMAFMRWLYYKCAARWWPADVKEVSDSLSDSVKKPEKEMTALEKHDELTDGCS